MLIARRLAAAVLTLSVIVATLLLGTAAAQAAPPRPAPPSAGATLTKVPMALDCESMSSSAREYAVKHRYCTTDGSVAPDGTEPGLCGLSWLWVFDWGNGTAAISYGFISSLGPVVRRSLGVSWYNWTTFGSGGFSDSGWMFSTGYGRTAPTWTGSGYVTAGLYGTVSLAWGGVCRVDYPTDGETIT